MSDRIFVAVAALFGLAGVAAGAFGAHALQGAADPRAAELVGLGSSYALWHALAMLAYVGLRGRSRVPLVLFAVGVVLFAASLVALALGAPRAVAYATPLGGAALLLGWGAFAVAAWRGGLGALDRG